MPIDKYVFGQRIRAARLSRNLSQTLLAEEIGVAPSTIAMYETGQRFPVLENLDALADALNLPMSYFLEDVPRPGRPADAEYRRFLTMFGEPSEDEQQLLSVFRLLNAAGRDKLMDYARDLSENDRYTKDTQSKAT